MPVAHSVPPPASRRVSFLGMYAAAVLTGKGPISNLLEHVANPATNSVLRWLA